MRRPDPRVISVVIPARDEEDLLGGALRAMSAARDRVADMAVEIVVVANGCRDRTAAVAREHGVEVIETDQANVGRARSVGLAHALRRHAGHLSEVWLATTDADSRVPVTWFETHRAAAASGADVCLGTVALHRRDRRDAQAWVDAYEARASREAVHGHIHGANLGFSALAYDLVGGFSPLALSEDADLVRRLLACGAHPTWCADPPVITSARRVGRASGGVASDISGHLDHAPGVGAREDGAA